MVKGGGARRQAALSSWKLERELQPTTLTVLPWR
jgi:hypothetical protein